MKSKALTSIVSVILLLCISSGMLLALSGCGDSGREYHEDICLSPDGLQGQVIIREWSFLLGSGAEIYYRQDGTEHLLGRTTGGDDGYCPFQSGRYTLALEGNTLVIRWCKFPTRGEDAWITDTFTLPEAAP